MSNHGDLNTYTMTFCPPLSIVCQNVNTIGTSNTHTNVHAIFG